MTEPTAATAPTVLDHGLTLMMATPDAHQVAYSLDIQTLLIITTLAFLPGILLLMTAFTRIVVVLAIFRQALGLTTTPPNMVLIALALIMTAFVMRPTIETVNQNAVQPYLTNKIGFEDAVNAAQTPMRAWMLSQTRKRELRLFINLAGTTAYPEPTAVPMLILVPAFVTSELQTALEIGFLIYIPFVLVDLAVASILMALGMIMVSPTLISLPIKLMLFVSIGGWDLLMGSMARSFIH
jgi:flagellar biosynthetic protein FliP